MCLFVCAVDHGVTEEEPVDEPYHEQVCEDQYRDPEPEGQYLDLNLPEGFEDGKFNLILWMHISTQFYKHNLLAYFIKLHMFLLLKHGWIATHWFVIIIPWPPRLTSIYDLFFMDVNRC